MSTGSVRDEDRLNTWAAIAHHIGRDVRTAKRYEHERGLPIRRMPGTSTSTVYAFRRELDDWLSGAPVKPSGDAQQRAAAPSRPKARSPKLARRRIWLAAAVTAAAVTALVAALLGLRAAHPPPSRPDPATAGLLKDGAFFLNERTSASLALAIDRFTQAIVRDPQSAEAYAGLADAYDLAPEFAAMAPADAYPRAQAAAERAVALDPHSAQAQRALGFVRFWWKGDARGADIAFRRSLRLNPHASLTHQWYANTLAARADPRALGEVDRALQLNPSVAVVADRGYVLLSLERYADAASVLRSVIALRPDYAPAYAYLVLWARRVGEPQAELKDELSLSDLRRQPQRAALFARALETLRRAGVKPMREQLARGLSDLEPTGQATAVEVAIADSDLRNRSATLAALERARSARSPAIAALCFNSDFAWLASDVSFRALCPAR